MPPCSGLRCPLWSVQAQAVPMPHLSARSRRRSHGQGTFGPKPSPSPAAGRPISGFGWPGLGARPRWDGHGRSRQIDARLARAARGTRARSWPAQSHDSEQGQALLHSVYCLPHPAGSYSPGASGAASRQAWRAARRHIRSSRPPKRAPSGFCSARWSVARCVSVRWVCQREGWVGGRGVCQWERRRSVCRREKEKRWTALLKVPENSRLAAALLRSGRSSMCRVSSLCRGTGRQNAMMETITCPRWYHIIPVATEASDKSPMSLPMLHGFDFRCADGHSR